MKCVPHKETEKDESLTAVQTTVDVEVEFDCDSNRCSRLVLRRIGEYAYIATNRFMWNQLP
jgi:curli biogenesis system outer membrane secretion channel CsgG